MENKRNQTMIPLQLPKELQEELSRFRKRMYPEKSEEEWYAFVVRTGLAAVKSEEKESSNSNQN